MNPILNANVKKFPTEENKIPTLETPVQLDSREIKLDAMVEHMADEIQASLHQHLYQAMVKTMHQIVHQESTKLHTKILEQLKQQLPELIETACHQNSDKHSA